MDCYVFEAMLEDLERETVLPAAAHAQALQHAENCAYCRARLAAARLLSLELQTLAREDQKLQAPAQVEAALRAAFRARKQRDFQLRRRARWAGVAAAVAVAVSLAARPWRHSAPAPPASVQARRSAPAPQAPAVKAVPEVETADSTATATALAADSDAKQATELAERHARSRPASRRTAAEVGSEFIALSGSSYPVGDGMVVRVQVPRSAPALVGLPVSAGDFSGTVTADVVLGEDGVARAIRFVPPQEPQAIKQKGVVREN